MTNSRWFPREQRKIFFNSRRHLSTIAREPKRESHFQHLELILRDDTKMVLTSFQHWCQMSNMNIFNMEKIRMSLMGSTTSLFKCSKKMDSYVAGTRQKYWSDRREWWCTQVKTTSRNTIKIVLGTEFDLTIAQLKSNIGRIAYSK
jgi:hypothetical protein